MLFNSPPNYFRSANLFQRKPARLPLFLLIAEYAAAVPCRNFRENGLIPILDKELLPRAYGFQPELLPESMSLQLRPFPKHQIVGYPEKERSKKWFGREV